MQQSPIRDAATVIVHRESRGTREILVGQRGSRAAFMPNKVVFPGGAVDPGDANVPLVGRPDALCLTRLQDDCLTSSPDALVTAAIRELWEESGLVLGRPGTWPSPPEDWSTFAQTGHLPSGEGLEFVFRAITPPGRPRRFDARFFMVSADWIQGDPNDFSAASDELSKLQWIALERISDFDLPFITQVVVSEVIQRLSSGARQRTVPFFRNDDETSIFKRLGN